MAVTLLVVTPERRLGRHERSFAATPEGVRDARRWVRSVLAPVHDEPVATAELVVTELGANVARHTSDADFLVEVDDDHVRRLIHLSVSDGMDTDLRVTAAEGDAESGRGLAIIEALSARWGVERTGTGKRVWVELRA